MFLLLGMRTVASVMFTVTFVCGQGGTRATQQIVRQQRKVTAFFIPLFPIGSSWAVECSHCGVATGLTRQQAEHSLRWASAQGLAVG